MTAASSGLSIRLVQLSLALSAGRRSLHHPPNNTTPFTHSRHLPLLNPTRRLCGSLTSALTHTQTLGASTGRRSEPRCAPLAWLCAERSAAASAMPPPQSTGYRCAEVQGRLPGRVLCRNTQGCRCGEREHDHRSRGQKASSLYAITPSRLQYQAHTHKPTRARNHAHADILCHHGTAVWPQRPARAYRAT